MDEEPTEPDLSDSAAPQQEQTPQKEYTGEVEEYEWPLELSGDILISGKPKIAFLSGEERKYYPENPGHSKLGCWFSLNTHKGDTPNPTYFCEPIGIRKPISNKGYGIGGLSAPRFPSNKKLLQEKRPEPGDYQTIHMYPARPRPDDVQNPLLRRQCKVSFGSNVKVSRFGVEEHPRAPGPGTYNFMSCRGCSTVKAKESFGSHRCVPTIITICRFVGGELCHECGQEQLFDYYRTKRPIAHHAAKPGKAIFGVMCRSCYCAAFHGHNPHWTRKLLTLLFQKVRHCSYKHEHYGLPNKVTKSTPMDVARLTRKEVLLGRFYADTCPPEIISS